MTMPAPPSGICQRRLTFTHERVFPGLVNQPRHWVRSNPKASEIAFLMRDDSGIVQLWLISPQGSTASAYPMHYEYSVSLKLAPIGEMAGICTGEQNCLL